MKEVNVFIFRRDLRIEDNAALIKLSQHNNKPILPIFIFNPQQIDSSRNPYYSHACFNFMLECITELKATLSNLHVFQGNDVSVLTRILGKCKISAVGYNTDHTPFAKHRDDIIVEWCKKNSIDIVTANDYVLINYEDKKLRENGCYEVYTPFYRKVLQLISAIPKPAGRIAQRRWCTDKVNGTVNIPSPQKLPAQRNIMGGRKNALFILKNIQDGAFKQYDATRNIPALDKTTKMSAFLKFGCISIREAFWECYNKYGKEHGLVRELLWREFYAHITWHTPRVLQGEPMKLRYKNSILWKDDTNDMFKKWCEGNTGFPFVDAGMRCLIHTGFLHNRLRMVVAMFLVKDLHIDWRQGERFFAQCLVDYDPASNSGGWQWATGIGADAQPYYRLFNPWVQSLKFDRNADFIKKWIPELTDVPSKQIHEWHLYHNTHPDIKYPKPIIDHKQEAQTALLMFQQSLRKIKGS